MSGPGEIVGKLYDCADEACQQRARTMMSSIGEAATAVMAAEALVEANKQAAAAAAASAAAGAAKDGALAAGKAIGEAAAGAAGAAPDAANKTPEPFEAAKEVASPTQTPSETLVQPCVNSFAAKKARLEARAALSAAGDKSSDPAVKAAAARLTRNTESVEMAKLSEDTYAQYPLKPGHQPPEGWTVMSDAELEAKGIDKRLLADSKAVIYRSDKDWPGGQKTVLAFRGTADAEDAVVDHDQALGLPTRQYEAATELGIEVGESLGHDVLVTGHSLGGGKAQAAGTTGGLKGMMFNSAGLHPNTVGGNMPEASKFQQYRTPGDPLTGAQNSGALQGLVGVVGFVAMPVGAIVEGGDKLLKALGMSGLSTANADYADKAFKAFPRAVKNLFSDGFVMPPAIGAITEVPSINEKGEALALLNPNQHSVTFLKNGIEKQKTEDMDTLKPSL